MSPETRKTPAATGVSRQNTNHYEGEPAVTSVATPLADAQCQRPDLPPTKDREIINFDLGRSTPEELAFSESEELHLLETRYVLMDKPRPANFRNPDGVVFRCAGDLNIRTCRDGERRFVVYVHADSLDHDFRFFDRIIRRARAGRMQGWKRYTFKNGDEGWIFDYINYALDPIDEFKPAEVIITDSLEASTNVGFGSTWGYRCEETACRDAVHEPEEASHTLEVVERQLGRWGTYVIEICKDISKPDSDWYLNTWTRGELDEMTPEQVTTYANDLNWMAIECSTANVKQKKRLRRPSHVDDRLRELDD